MLDNDLRKILLATNDIADQIRTIKNRMEGRGISPAEAPIVMDRFTEIENRLRMIGADKDNVVPWLDGL
jgi:hypothetical protein